MIKTAPINAVFGAYFGMLMQAWWLDGLQSCGEPKVFWLVKLLGRGVVAIVVAGPFYALWYIGAPSNEWFLDSLMWFVPFFSCFFLLFSVVDVLCLKCKLYDSRNSGLDNEQSTILYGGYT